MSNSNNNIINLVLSKALPFVVFRLPGEKTIYFLIQKSRKINKYNFDVLNTFSGFVISSFSSFKTKEFYGLKPDIFFMEHHSELIKHKLADFPNGKIEYANSNDQTYKNEYLLKAKNIIKLIKRGDLQKVVLSRYLYHKINNLDISLLFNTLNSEYPNAFVYLFYLPTIGLWTGATPETLLKKTENSFETIALAGTKLSLSKKQWQQKEYAEQQYVVDFIENNLKKLNIKNYKKLPKKTINAGAISHLCTEFKIPTGSLFGKTAQLIDMLHPTPAVGGLPQKKACDIITSVEKYNRRFYTGFLGPWNMSEMNYLFVNLRCAEILENALGLYVGGGITIDSDVEAEWIETENKSKTILSIVKKLHTFAP